MKRTHVHLSLALFLALSMTAAGCKNTGGGNSLLSLLGLMGGGGPRVISAQPVNGATGVSRTTTVSARFNTDMDASTITSDNFTLEGGPGVIVATVNYDTGTRTATFTLISPASLEYLTQYTATITTDVHDANGVYLSNDVQWTFTTLAEGTVPAPSFDPMASTYESARDVTITCTDGSATIHYTTNGTDPSRSNGDTYSGTPVHIDANTDLRAMAFRDGWIDSSVTQGNYYIRTASPVFDPLGAEYDEDQDVTITAPGATIYYTMETGTALSPPDDPADPATSSPVYGGSIAVGGHNTVVKIKAMALAPGMAPSPVVMETYSIVYGQAAAPSFDPVAGTYTGTQNVTISSTTSGATIMYTTDGVTEPSFTVGTEYNGAVEISENTTLKAMAHKDGMVDSTVTTGAFNIRVAAPTFDPAAGTHAEDIEIAINSSGDAVYYEMTSATGSTPPDPADPTTSSTQYTTPIDASGHTTIVKIKAIAVKSGMTQSEISYGEFLIDWSGTTARWNEAIWGIHKWNP
ncbi:MAG: chitobiase/beta-hexosaminidase C-terminal domain-containing protein [Spirochaetes bacterium]|nr:chitobiase/beta-hexosaminidase C-terminal domain-containing protein [Spirochaetota bacterium]